LFWQDPQFGERLITMMAALVLVLQIMMVAQRGLVTNIRRANIEERGGWVIVEVDGDDERIADAVVWLAERGLGVDRIDE